MLYPIATFTHPPIHPSTHPPTYWYKGRCPRTGEFLRLPRTMFVESIARGLMQQLGDRREFQAGKMYGVLLVETPSGEPAVLQAFSGLLNGESIVPGWVPPISGRDRAALSEAQTLAQLDAIKRELIELQAIPQRQEYETRSQFWQQQLDKLTRQQQQRQQTRQTKRESLQATLGGDELAQALGTLDNESRRDKSDRRNLKQQRDAELKPLQQIIDIANARILALKLQRKERSRYLQAELFRAHQLTRFAGATAALDSFMLQGFLPIGGECAAPKLLHYAATHHLKPIALAEFWWGSPSPDGEKVPGQFYAACSDRCQPMLGFLLSGLSQVISSQAVQGECPSSPPNTPLPLQGESLEGTKPAQSVLSQQAILTTQSPPSLLWSGNCQMGDSGGNAAPLTILYEDEFLIAIDKPAGLLSVPGRYGDRQDSVLSRLIGSREQGAGSREQEATSLTHSSTPPPLHPSTHLPIYSSTLTPIHPSTLLPVHRLDQDTSGVMLLAKDRESYRKLAEQFQRRQVQKIYEAILDGVLTQDEGTIDLPLWSDPTDRPYQKVDWQRGKPSLTKFRVLGRSQAQTRVELIPLTGRTHQLRVHTAIGLDLPIGGDRLYGRNTGDRRLYLHARELQIEHPRSGCWLQIKANLPF